MAGGVPNRGDQVGALGLQPGERRRGIGEAAGRGNRSGKAQHVRVQQVRGGIDCAQVPVVQALLGCLHAHALVVAGALGGVPAEQVAKRVLVGRGLFDQVGAGQPLQQHLRPPRVDAGEGRRRVSGEVSAGHEPQQAEQLTRRWGERRVREVERNPYRTVLVAVDGERGQAVAAGQLGGVVRDAEPGAQRQVGRGDPQCQREVRAHPGQLSRRLRLGADAVTAEHAGQQHLRPRGVEHVEGEVTGAVVGDQAAKPVPAGDQHDAARAAGQQRADLLGVAGVVEHDQHPPVGQQRAVLGRRRLRLERHLFCRHAEGLQEPGQRLDGAHRRGRRISPKVDVELAVREPLPRPMPPAHGERGLADTGSTTDHTNGHAVFGGDQQLVKLLQLPCPAGERGRWRGQLRGPRQFWSCRFRPAGRPAALPAVDLHRIGAGPDGPVQLLQHGTRFDPELLDQQLPQLPENRQRVGPPVCTEQRQQKLCPQPLAQRVGPDAGPQLIDKAGVVTQP